MISFRIPLATGTPNYFVYVVETHRGYRNRLVDIRAITASDGKDHDTAQQAMWAALAEIRARR